MDRAAGTTAGSWFEFYGSRLSPPFPQVGITPWTWAETMTLCVDHILGLRPEERSVRIRPRLLPGLDHASGRVPFGSGWLNLDVSRDSAMSEPMIRVSSDGGPTVETRTHEVLVRPVGGRTSIEVVLPK